MDKPERGDDLGILARRKIEAAVIAPIYDEMRAAFGEERAREVLRRAIRRAAVAAGAEMAATRARRGGSRKLQGHPAPMDEGRRADDRGPRRRGPASSISTSPDAATPRPTAPWGLAGSATFCPATATAPSAKATIPAHQADPDANDHGRRKPVRFPLSRETAGSRRKTEALAAAAADGLITTLNCDAMGLLPG